MTDLAEETGEVPRALAERPVVHPHLEFEWRAFWALLSDRPAGPHAAIPFSSIDRYAERYGIRGADEFERFRDLLAALTAALNEAAASSVPSP